MVSGWVSSALYNAHNGRCYTQQSQYTDRSLPAATYVLVANCQLVFDRLYTVLQAIVLSHLTCAIAVWEQFHSVSLKQRIDVFLKRSFCYGLAEQIYNIIDPAMYDLFKQYNLVPAEGQ